MATLERRLAALEADNDAPGQLPEVVDDGMPDAELVRLRKHGREVMRYSEFLEHCV